MSSSSDDARETSAPDSAPVSSSPAKPVIRRKRRRLTLACTECHRRKQKCNLGRPCRNCSLRYPPVECVYQVAKPSTVKPSTPKDGSAIQDTSIPARSKSPASAESRGVTPIAIVKKKISGGMVYPGLGSEIPEALKTLSVEPTETNAELFNIYLKELMPRVWSIDGEGDPPDICKNILLPLTSSSSIIVHANLLRASIWKSKLQQTVAGQSLVNRAPKKSGDSAETIALKVKSLSLLNERLRSTDTNVDDESIAAVALFFFNEWCWNEADGLQGMVPHMKGLREMLRLRGGIHILLKSGTFLVKMITVCNYHLAVVLERESFLFTPQEQYYKFIPGYVPEIQGFASPFYRSAQSPKVDGNPWGVNKATAKVLDELYTLTDWINSYVSAVISKTESTDSMPPLLEISEHIAALPPPASPDTATVDCLVFECCRLAASTYCRAIIECIPLSLAARPADIDVLLLAISRVPLSRWKQIPGVWLWILCIVNPAARSRTQGATLRALLQGCMFYLSFWDWQFLVNCLESLLNVQRWSRGLGREYLHTVQGWKAV